MKLPSVHTILECQLLILSLNEQLLIQSVSLKLQNSYSTNKGYQNKRNWNIYPIIEKADPSLSRIYLLNLVKARAYSGRRQSVQLRNTQHQLVEAA